MKELVIHTHPSLFFRSPLPERIAPLLSSLPSLSYWCETVLLVSGGKVLSVFCVLYIGFVGKFWWASSGNYYDGGFKEGKMNGQGFNKEGKIIEQGKWENDKFIG